jgi:CRISPR-associated protein Cas6/Cse3/CasE subtype I-E
MHKGLQACFDGGGYGTPRSSQQGHLWRVDGNIVRVQSTSPADWSRLKSATVIASGPVLDYPDKSTLKFSLHANATVQQVRGKRLPVDDPFAWLDRQFERGGAKMTRCLVENRYLRRFRKETATISVSVVEYSGILVVENADLFLAKRITGFGPAKAWGCGLILLSPAR